jgi:PPOX class probable F420-dependent enzyme
MDAAAARERFAAERSARLATADASGRPHLVPIVFAVDGDAVYHAVDSKPKRTRALRRLRNVMENPRVALLADRYDDDWSHLWWVRADGVGRVVELGDPVAERALELLAARYEQYRAARPGGPVIAIQVEKWSGWSAAD